MKIVVIDGQGGKMGAAIVERLCSAGHEVTAIGTNSTATAAMLKAGAGHAATGENPVVVACRDADYIIGPIGVVIANSLLGEITPKMAAAVGESPAKRVLIPVDRCNTVVAGVSELTLTEYVRLAVGQVGR